MQPSSGTTTIFYPYRYYFITPFALLSMTIRAADLRLNYAQKRLGIISWSEIDMSEMSVIMGSPTLGMDAGGHAKGDSTTDDSKLGSTDDKGLHSG
ncbi:hypothetical protein Tco_0723857 [Tanacetum coccineum]